MSWSPPPPPPPAPPVPPTAPSTGAVAGPSAGPAVARPLAPQVRQLWFIEATIGTFIAVALLVGVTVLSVGLAAGSAPWWPVVAGVVGFAVLTVFAHRRTRLAHEHWRWTLTDRALEIQRGVWWRTTSVVPYARLQQIDVDQGPLERRLGIVTLQLRTAAATTDASIPGIRADEADEVRAGILERAGRGDAV